MLLSRVSVALLVGVLAVPGLVEAAPHGGGGGGHAGGGGHGGYGGGYGHGYGGYGHGYGGYGHGYGGFGYGGYGYGRSYGGFGYGGYGLYPYGGSGYYPYSYGAYPYLTSPYYLSGGVSWPYASGPAYVPSTLPSGGVSPYANTSPPTQPGGLTTANYQSETPAEVVIRVPANAEVWIEGDKTQQKGATRVFQSPPLDSGRAFHYQVKARWMDNGKPVEVERKVPVHAGERSVVDFLKPA